MPAANSQMEPANWEMLTSQCLMGSSNWEMNTVECKVGKIRMQNDKYKICYQEKSTKNSSIQNEK